MPFSFHSHSGDFCNHAEGTLEGMVEAAINKGFVSFGLSEHMPRSSAKYLYPEEIACQITPEKLSLTFEKYVQAARTIQEKEKDKIQILVGLESEYTCRSDLDAVLKLRSLHNLDYVMGSVHHVEGIPIDYDDETYKSAEKLLGGTENVFLRYLDLQQEMITVLKPEIIGHFDVIRLLRPNEPLTPAIWDAIRRNVRLGISYGALFEVNASGLRKGLIGAYPLPDILDYIVAEGGKLTVCDDSHQASHVGTHYKELRDYLIEHNVCKIYYLHRDKESKKISVLQFQDDWPSHPSWTK
eukprot:CFRG3053T1